jgi:hypothetical protein
MYKEMTNLSAAVLRAIQDDGYVLLQAVFSPEQVTEIAQQLMNALEQPTPEEGAIHSEAGNLYAARNLLTLWPPVAGIWRQPPLPDALGAVLGTGSGLVRVLFFDKPPHQTWGLPWHKDLTIAVRENRLPSSHFSKPTRKAGVPHVEAPRELLERMLTARIHLDDVTEENGPLKVIPGSHRLGKALSNGEALPRTVLARRGDVLLIRPLVEHCSIRSFPDTSRHRRILHLEFARQRHLPDGYAWHDFIASEMPVN